MEGRIPRGILNERLARTKFTLTRHEPAPGLRPFVDYYWILRWDLRGSPSHEQRVLPNLAVNVSLFEKAAAVFGPAHQAFSYVVAEAAHGLGARFRPGCFRPFLGAPVSSIADRPVALDAVFGSAARGIIDRIRDAADDREMVTIADSLLGENIPKLTPRSIKAMTAVEMIAADPALTKVDQLSRRCGISMRSLQRLFPEHVGVSPKWAIRVYRLNDAAQRIDASVRVDFARLAADLGYSDQAHFTRDFTEAVGIPPGKYHSG